MRIFTLIVLVISLVAAPVAAQDTAGASHRAVQLAAASALNAHLARGAPDATRQRVLAPSSPLYRFDGARLLHDASATQRSPEANMAWADLLGARVGTSADSIWCVPRERCFGTDGYLLRVSEPWIAGDSAAILYILETRASPDPRYKQDHQSAFMELIFLKRVDGVWRAVSAAQPGGVGPRANLSPVYPVRGN